MLIADRGKISSVEHRKPFAKVHAIASLAQGDICLFENVVHGTPTKDIAEMMGCSVRNVTKHRKVALDKIRFLVTGKMEIEG